MVPLLPDRLRCLSDTLHKRVRAGTVIPAPYTECDWYLPRDHDAWSLALTRHDSSNVPARRRLFEIFATLFGRQRQKVEFHLTPPWQVPEKCRASTPVPEANRRATPAACWPE